MATFVKYQIVNFIENNNLFTFLFKKTFLFANERHKRQFVVLFYTRVHFLVALICIGKHSSFKVHSRFENGAIRFFYSCSTPQYVENSFRFNGKAEVAFHHESEAEKLLSSLRNFIGFFNGKHPNTV